MIAEIIVSFLDARDETKRLREEKALKKFNEDFYAWLDEYRNSQSRKAL